MHHVAGIPGAYPVPRVLRTVRASPGAARASIDGGQGDFGSATPCSRHRGRGEAGVPQHFGGIFAGKVFPDRAHEGGSDVQRWLPWIVCSDFVDVLL